MTTNNGWIKLHRQTLDNPTLEGRRLALWVTLLLLATHAEQEVMFGGKRITLKAGQFITGRKYLSQKSHYSEGAIEKVLLVFEKEQQIEQQKSNKNRLITILNWVPFQQKEQQKEQQSDNRVTTEEQQSDTYKKDKTVKTERMKEPQQGDCAKLLVKWFTGMDGVDNPEGLARFYLQKFPEKTIVKALKNNNCTNRAKFSELLTQYA